MSLLLSDSARDHTEYWKWQYPPPDSFVYVVRAEGDTPIKVGKGDRDLNRLAAIQTGNPRPLRLLSVLVGGLDLEDALHRRIGKRARMTGEWFDGNQIPAFLSFAANLASAMVAHHEATGEIPDWRKLSDLKPRPSRAKREPAPVVTHHVEPAPVPPAEQRRRRERAFMGFTRT